MGDRILGLFQGVGVEAEYMIVDRESLSVRPLSELVLRNEAGNVVSEIQDGPLGLSNEFMKHLIELKTAGPAPSPEGLEGIFTAGIRKLNHRLGECGAMLLPTAMHPLMDPVREAVLWDHGELEIYQTYHRIFDCSRHGWANLQSLHLNLPFRDDAEFALLHAAVRVVLPLIPALAASSPLMEGKITGWKDTRLEVYRTNQERIPSIIGDVIPEDVYSLKEYEERILEPMYRDIAPLDPEGIVSDEWLNSRGAIARFDRNTVEIRLIDTQECASMDMAVAAAVYYLVRGLVEGFFTAPLALRRASTAMLRGILDRAVRDGGDALIGERDYLGLFGLDSKPRKASLLWRLLTGSLAERYPEVRVYLPRLDVIAEEGTLSDRILRGIGNDVTRDSIIRVYRRLASCLDGDLPYRP